MNFFGKNINYLRKKRGLSRQELADKLNVNQSTISRWENENMGVNLDNAYDAANLFNVSIADLTGKDLSLSEVPKYSELEILFDKAKGILSEDDEATIRSVVERTIEKYEKNKNNNQ